MSRAAPIIALAIAITGCASSNETAIRLALEYDDAWALDELEISSPGRTSRVPAAHEVRIQLAAGSASAPLDLVVTGRRGAIRYATGSVRVQPILSTEVRATLVLARLACGAWCTPGATQCVGDAVVVCDPRDGDQCLEWSPPVRCPADAPACSLGECRDECVDECAEDDRECVGPGAWRTCGEGDSDPCLDWLPATACGGESVCSRGECRAACASECAEGDVECHGGAIVRCGDRNLDGCLEWGPPEPCATGETCESGTCRPIASCEDECVADVCDGATFRECGNYDHDPCLEPSPGASCAPADGCELGGCTVTGCATTPRVCDVAPAAQCLDDDTLLVFDASGTCTDGDCVYPSREQECPRCPACDACAGVACDSPPNACYAPSGTCSGGSCSYAYLDGASCDDGDACTERDSCASGTCAGVARRCESPPSGCYVSIGACTDGACSYAYRDGVACDDRDPGTIDDQCTSGRCEGMPDSGVWSEIAAGSDFACARRSSGTVMCWGLNSSGQLGDGSRTGSTVPVWVVGLHDAVEISAGHRHACARRRSGAVVCWGEGREGQLGNGAMGSSHRPVEVVDLEDAIELGAGHEFTCALRASGQVVCWGANASGQLGNGTSAGSTRPVPVEDLGDARALSVSSHYLSSNACAIREGGSVVCWGANDVGQLGNDTTLDQSTPVAVGGLGGVVEVAAGRTSCARRESGTVLCWGANGYGQFGNGSTVDSDVPVAGAGSATDVDEIDVGDFHTCARRGTSVACWGYNESGQVGDGTAERRYSPAVVGGVSDVAQLAIAGSHSCARSSTGTVWCWGANEDGQLGDGTTTSRRSPVRVMLP
jgi:alpha-tubulin suppressor-like RCC1 family protein